MFSKGKSSNPGGDGHLYTEGKIFDSFVWCKSNILLLNCNNIVPHSIGHVVSNEANALGPHEVEDDEAHLVDSEEAGESINGMVLVEETNSPVHAC